MFGIIMVAVMTGLIGVQLIKRKNVKDYTGAPIAIEPKEKGFARYIIGGTLFGLGWAMVGSCPGPIFILLGAGFWGAGVILLGALLGTYIYGLLKDILPH